MDILLILGMHRSGTSLLARTLVAMGASPGQDMLREPMPDNPDGYWELAGVVQAQQRLLDALGRSLPKAEAALPMPAGWLEHPATRRAVAELSEALGQELAALAPGAPPLVVKDPRTMMLLPLWQEVLTRMKVQARCVMVVRSPAAVAASLAARDGIPLALGEAAWLRHHAEALRHIGRGLRRVLSYQALVENPEGEARSLAAALELQLRMPVPVLANPALRHHADGEPAIFPMAAALYHRLLTLPEPARAPEVAAPVLAGFEGGISLLGSNLALLRHGLEYGAPAPRTRPLVLTERLLDGKAVHRSVPLLAGPTTVSLRNGNPYCRLAKGGFVLHPNPPGEPPAQVSFNNMMLVQGPLALTCGLALLEGSEPMLVRASLQRNTETLAEASIILKGGETLRWEPGMEVPKAGAASLVLDVAPAPGAANSYNAHLSFTGVEIAAGPLME